MLICVSNEITVTNPTDDLKKWCQKNLVFSNPEYVKKQRMGFWIGNTPATIALYAEQGNELILPYGIQSDLTKFMSNTDIVVNDFSNRTKVEYKAHVNLYDYQEKAVDAMVHATYGILQSPAGSGKTQMGVALTNRIGKRTLWLCHTKDLINQSKERFEKYIDKSLMGTITEGKINIGSGITFATIQTMSKINLEAYKHYWDCIIVDEVHRVAGSPTQMTQYEKVLSSLSARHKYGLSATVHRSDGMIQATYALVGSIAYSVSEEEVADKIMKVGIKPVECNIQLERSALNYDGTINYVKTINYLSENERRNQIISDSIIANSDYSCLILSDRLNQLEILKNKLPQEMQEKAVMISGKMTSKKAKAEREQAIEDMRAGKKKLLFASYSLAKEGLDIPRLERLFMATPVKDYAVVAQSVGRIARTFEGKAEPICYDFVDINIYCQKAFKRRCTTYRKIGCYFI